MRSAIPLGAALAVSLIIILLAGIQYSFLQSQYSKLQGENNSLETEKVSLQVSVTSLSNSLYAEEEKILAIQDNFSKLQGNVTLLKQNIASLEYQRGILQSNIVSQSQEIINLQNQNVNLSSQINNISDSPKTFGIWNSPMNFSKGSFTYETVPDTFIYNDNWKASGNFTVYYFTVYQYFNFDTCGLQCVNGAYVKEGPSSSSSFSFGLARGCGAYLAVYQASENATIYPNISVTYSPGPGSGICG